MRGKKARKPNNHGRSRQHQFGVWKNHGLECDRRTFWHPSLHPQHFSNSCPKWILTYARHEARTTGKTVSMRIPCECNLSVTHRKHMKDDGEACNETTRTYRTHKPVDGEVDIRFTRSGR